MTKPAWPADLRDPPQFVAWQARRTLTRTGKLTEHELVEAADEAMVIAVELYEEWDPVRCPKFSAFLLSYLPRRLIDWFRKEIRQSGRGSWNGEKASYTYFGTISLDDSSVTETLTQHTPGLD